MAGIGVLIRVAGRIGGRILGRVAGPLGAALTIGELGYLGLKYSGTLENFKKLYCDKCRSEISMKYVGKIASDYNVGSLFEVLCPLCHQSHSLTKIDLLCSNCQKKSDKPPKIHKIDAPSQVDYLFLTCPQCFRPIKFAKNVS